jgi:hypothetical protein
MSQKKEFPKYFVHVNEFRDGTIYVIVKNNKIGYCVSANGIGEEFSPPNALNSAFDYVKRGDWKEISQRTAQRRLKKAKELEWG